MPMTDLQRFPNAMRPAWVYNDDPARGMAPAMFLNGTEWGGWEGQLLVGIMGANQLWRLIINDQQNSTEQIQIAGEEDGNPFTPTRFRALTLAPDNSLYVVNEAGEDSTIYRVVARSSGGADAGLPSGATPPTGNSSGGSGSGGADVPSASSPESAGSGADNGTDETGEAGRDSTWGLIMLACAALIAIM